MPADDLISAMSCQHCSKSSHPTSRCWKLLRDILNGKIEPTTYSLQAPDGQLNDQSSKPADENRKVCAIKDDKREDLQTPDGERAESTSTPSEEKQCKIRAIVSDACDSEPDRQYLDTGEDRYLVDGFQVSQNDKISVHEQRSFPDFSSVTNTSSPINPFERQACETRSTSRAQESQSPGHISPPEATELTRAESSGSTQFNLIRGEPRTFSEQRTSRATELFVPASTDQLGTTQINHLNDYPSRQPNRHIRINDRVEFLNEPKAAQFGRKTVSVCPDSSASSTSKDSNHVISGKSNQQTSIAHGYPQNGEQFNEHRFNALVSASVQFDQETRSIRSEDSASLAGQLSASAHVQFDRSMQSVRSVCIASFTNPSKSPAKPCDLRSSTHRRTVPYADGFRKQMTSICEMHPNQAPKSSSRASERANSSLRRPPMTDWYSARAAKRTRQFPKRLTDGSQALIWKFEFKSDKNGKRMRAAARPIPLGNVQTKEGNEAKRRPAGLSRSSRQCKYRRRRPAAPGRVNREVQSVVDSVLFNVPLQPI